ncbi:hypothetical protein HK101_001439, partial [Irineochytrium annulatum]
ALSKSGDLRVRGSVEALGGVGEEAEEAEKMPEVKAVVVGTDGDVATEGTVAAVGKMRALVQRLKVADRPEVKEEAAAAAVPIIPAVEISATEGDAKRPILVGGERTSFSMATADGVDDVPGATSALPEATGSTPSTTAPPSPTPPATPSAQAGVGTPRPAPARLGPSASPAASDLPPTRGGSALDSAASALADPVSKGSTLQRNTSLNLNTSRCPSSSATSTMTAVPVPAVASDGAPVGSLAPVSEVGRGTDDGGPSEARRSVGADGSVGGGQAAALENVFPSKRDHARMASVSSSRAGVATAGAAPGHVGDGGESVGTSNRRIRRKRNQSDMRGGARTVTTITTTTDGSVRSDHGRHVINYLDAINVQNRDEADSSEFDGTSAGQPSPMAFPGLHTPRGSSHWSNFNELEPRPGTTTGSAHLGGTSSIGAVTWTRIQQDFHDDESDGDHADRGSMSSTSDAPPSNVDHNAGYRGLLRTASLYDPSRDPVLRQGPSSHGQDTFKPVQGTSRHALRRSNQDLVRAAQQASTSMLSSAQQPPITQLDAFLIARGASSASNSRTSQPTYGHRTRHASIDLDNPSRRLSSFQSSQSPLHDSAPPSHLRSQSFLPVPLQNRSLSAQAAPGTRRYQRQRSPALTASINSNPGMYKSGKRNRSRTTPAAPSPPSSPPAVSVPYAVWCGEATLASFNAPGASSGGPDAVAVVGLPNHPTGPGPGEGVDDEGLKYPRGSDDSNYMDAHVKLVQALRLQSAAKPRRGVNGANGNNAGGTLANLAERVHGGGVGAGGESNGSGAGAWSRFGRSCGRTWGRVERRAGIAAALAVVVASVPVAIWAWSYLEAQGWSSAQAALQTVSDRAGDEVLGVWGGVVGVGALVASVVVGANGSLGQGAFAGAATLAVGSFEKSTMGGAAGAIGAVAWVPRVLSAADRAAWEKGVGQAFLTANYTSNLLEVEAQQAGGYEYFPVEWSQPLTDPHLVPGYDLNSDGSVRSSSVAAARQRPSATLSQTLTLLPPIVPQSGLDWTMRHVLALTPVFLAAGSTTQPSFNHPPVTLTADVVGSLWGFVGVSVVPGGMLASAVRSRGVIGNGMSVWLFDGVAPMGQQFLGVFVGGNGPQPSNSQSMLSADDVTGALRAETNVAVGSRNWTLVTVADSNFAKPYVNSKWPISVMVLIFAVGLSGLVVLSLIAIIHRLRRRRMVDEFGFDDEAKS